MKYSLKEYLEWRGDLSFMADPFHEIDALLLSTIAYVEFDEIISPNPKEQISFFDAAQLFKTHQHEEKYKKVGLIIPEDVIDLFLQMAECERYKNLKASAYVNYIDEANEKQFCALTVFNSDTNEIYIVYRGTDDTLIGWREDFNMAFLEEVPAQQDAVLYFRNILRNLRGKIRIMGHSKGGNLAVYSAVRGGKIGQRCLKQVYCMDGPGFTKKFLGLTAYESIDDKVYWYLPYESIIGMVLYHGKNEVIISCKAKGFAQHNPFSWIIHRNGFEREAELSKEAKLIHLAIIECMEKLTLEQRKLFVEKLFSVFQSTNAKRLSDIRLKEFASLIDSVKNMDEDSKELFKKTGRIMLQSVKKNR